MVDGWSVICSSSFSVAIATTLLWWGVRQAKYREGALELSLLLLQVLRFCLSKQGRQIVRWRACGWRSLPLALQNFVTNKFDERIHLDFSGHGPDDTNFYLTETNAVQVHVNKGGISSSQGLTAEHRWTLLRHAHEKRRH